MTTAWPTRCSGRSPPAALVRTTVRHARRRPRCARRARPARRRGPRRGACGRGTAAPSRSPTRTERISPPWPTRGRGGEARAGRRWRPRRSAAPNASAAGAQPEPMTTATSCGPPRAAVRSLGGQGGEGGGIGSGGLGHARTLTQRTANGARPPAGRDRARWSPLPARTGATVRSMRDRGPRTAGGPRRRPRPRAGAGSEGAAAPGRRSPPARPGGQHRPLVESLWDGDPPPSARKSLQAHVVRLRSALEPDRPQGSTGRYVVRRGHGLRPGGRPGRRRRPPHRRSRRPRPRPAGLGRAGGGRAPAGRRRRAVARGAVRRLARTPPSPTRSGGGWPRCAPARVAGLLEARLALGRHAEVRPGAGAAGRRGAAARGLVAAADAGPLPGGPAGRRARRRAAGRGRCSPRNWAPIPDRRCATWRRRSWRRTRRSTCRRPPAPRPAPDDGPSRRDRALPVQGPGRLPGRRRAAVPRPAAARREPGRPAGRRAAARGLRAERCGQVLRGPGRAGAGAGRRRAARQPDVATGVVTPGRRRSTCSRR